MLEEEQRHLYDIVDLVDAVVLLAWCLSLQQTERSYSAFEDLVSKSVALSKVENYSSALLKEIAKAQSRETHLACFCSGVFRDPINLGVDRETIDCQKKISCSTYSLCAIAELGETSRGEREREMNEG